MNCDHCGKATVFEKQYYEEVDAKLVICNECFQCTDYENMLLDAKSNTYIKPENVEVIKAAIRKLNSALTDLQFAGVNVRIRKIVGNNDALIRIPRAEGSFMYATRNNQRKSVAYIRKFYLEEEE